MPNSEDELRAAITDLLLDDYTCIRVWAAWEIGTMTSDDFIPLEETDRVEEIMKLIKQEANRRAEEGHRMGYMRGVNDFSGYYMDASIPAQRRLIMPHIREDLIADYKPMPRYYYLPTEL